MIINTILAVGLLLFQDTAATATFEGEFKSADKKYVVVELAEGGTMRMFITGATKFVREGKRSRASEFHEGEHVLVDAQRDLRMNMLAARVEWHAGAKVPK